MPQSPVIEKLIHQIDAKHDRQQQIIPNPIIKVLPNYEQ